MSTCRTNPAVTPAKGDGLIDPKHSALYAIRFARARFDDIANRIEGIVWEAEPGSRQLGFISTQVGQMLGYGVEQCCADDFWNTHIHPEDRTRIIQMRAAATNPTIDYVAEYRMLAHDGRSVWLRDTFKLVATAPMPLLRGILTDISQRKFAEEALRFSDTLFQYCTDSVTITDGTMRIQRVNAAFSAITGYHPDEVRGQTPRILHSGVQDHGFYHAMWKAIEEHGHWSGELWNRRKSGDLYIQHLSITRLCNDRGEVVNYLGVARDVSQCKAVEDQIEQLTHVDAMTGLPNRAHLTARLDRAIASAQQTSSRFAVLAVDIDRVAYINDTLGHHIGDQLLIAVAERLCKTVRDTGSVSRHIGDEFTVVSEQVSTLELTAALAERILSALAQPFALDGHEVVVSACVGISQYPQDGGTPDLLLKHADVALHDAKVAGANQYRFFHAEMKDGALQRLRIESSLRQALQRNEFEVHYQPQLDLSSGKINGMEALVRWRHPEMGMVSPAHFIPIAEKTGNIIELGLWVTQQACTATHRWQQDGYADLRVAVNVSAHQLAHDDFTRQIRRILQQTGLPAASLELELTESMIMQRPERVVAILEELRALGVQFSIDDFGTGYSSLSQLKRFPIDKLKIDQSFTHDIEKDDNGAAITRTIIALGHSMGLRVIAEGVETEGQKRFLQDNGCHGMQGYLFSRPLPVKDFSSLLAQHRVNVTGCNA